MNHFFHGNTLFKVDHSFKFVFKHICHRNLVDNHNIFMKFVRCIRECAIFKCGFKYILIHLASYIYCSTESDRELDVFKMSLLKFRVSWLVFVTNAPLATSCLSMNLKSEIIDVNYNNTKWSTIVY